MNFLVSNTLVLSAPLILSAIGGYVSERSGVINIALEGNMLSAAILTAVVGAATHNPLLGLCGGIAGSIVLSWMHWLLTQIYRLDHIVSGMALNAIAYGGADYCAKRLLDPNAGEMPHLNVNVFYVAAFALPLIVGLFTSMSRGGLRLLAVGNDPEKARQMGVFPPRIRFVALTFTGIFCGLSGALIVTNAKYYTDNMTAGRGYIALAALIIGSWRPIPTLIACVFFGLFQALQFQLQGSAVLGLHLPREFWYCLPYLVTIIALAGFLGKGRAPASIGKY